MIDYSLLKSTLSFHEVLGHYGIATPTRERYRIPCFWHNGVDENLAIDEIKHSAYCFVCHKAGSVIDVVMSLDNCELPQAVEKLSHWSAIPLEASTLRTEWNRTKQRLEGWQELQKLPPSIEDELPPTIPLEDGYRGLSPELIRRFGLRRIPGDGWGSGVFIPCQEQDGSIVARLQSI